MDVIIGWIAIGVAVIIGAVVVYWVFLHIGDDPWIDDDWLR